MSTANDNRPFCEDCGAIISQEQAERDNRDAADAGQMLLGYICPKCWPVTIGNRCKLLNLSADGEDYIRPKVLEVGAEGEIIGYLPLCWVQHNYPEETEPRVIVLFEDNIEIALPRSSVELL